MRQVTTVVALMAALMAGRAGARAQNRTEALTDQQETQLAVSLTPPLPAVDTLRAIHASWCAIVAPTMPFPASSAPPRQTTR